MRVIGYTFDADVHCPGCARQALQAGQGVAIGQLDEHGVDSEQRDREGNVVHPIFTTDETAFFCCGDCGNPLT